MPMDFLTNNWLINLRGPDFLGVYLIIAVLVIAFAWYRTRMDDPTRGVLSPVVLEQLDPFEIAFLRGGHAELARLTIIDLIARRYLEVRGQERTTTIGSTPQPPDEKFLNPVARYVFDWMRRGRHMVDIVPGLTVQLIHSGVAVPMQQALEARQLVTTRRHREDASRRVWPYAAILLGLAGYKLFVALFLRGRTNVIFLIILAFVALAILVNVTKPGRLTALGRAYLKRVQSALTGLQTRVQSLISNSERDHLLLAVGAYGVGVLSGTSYNFAPTIFERDLRKHSDGGHYDGGGHSNSGSSSNCGAGCGSGGGGSASSSCSSGSCGGGSGCGGGGCGGCGGS